MTKFVRLIVAILCLVVMYAAAQNIFSVARAAPLPYALDLNQIVAYVQAVLAQPSEVDKIHLIALAAAAAILMLTTIGTRIRVVSEKEQLRRLKRTLEEASSAVSAGEGQQSQLEDLRHAASQLISRIETLESDDDGVAALTSEIDDTLSDIDDRLGDLETGKNSRQVGEVGEVIETMQATIDDIKKRTDALKGHKDTLVMMKTTLDTMDVSVRNMTDPHNGVISVIESINDVLGQLSGDNGILAALERGDPRTEEDLDAQLKKAQEQIAELTGALRRVDEHARIAHGYRGQLARLANGSMQPGSGH